MTMYINTTPQSRTGLSPYHIAFGRELKLPIDLALVPTRTPAVREFAEGLDRLWKDIRNRLECQREKDKARIG